MQNRVQQQHGPSRRAPEFLPLPHLGSGGWMTPDALSRAASPTEHGSPSGYTDAGPSHAVPSAPRPLRLSLLQHRADSTRPSDGPSLLSPVSPVRLGRAGGSALGIIVPPGTPPADALPRWLIDRTFSKRKSLSPEARSSSKGPAPRSPFEYSSYVLTPSIAPDWRTELRPLVQTPDPIEEHTSLPRVRSTDGFPFSFGISSERVCTPGSPQLRPRPLPRCSSDEMTEGPVLRVNAWGEHEPPTGAARGLFSLAQGQAERLTGAKHLPSSRLASRDHSPSRG